MTELELLREYAEPRSEEAFASLVSRYSGLVYSVAVRRVQNAQIAEEVTQAVFLLLARPGHSLRIAPCREFYIVPAGAGEKILPAAIW
jgi:DNA-directed RNA polymerase specialized sigma24 family protein